MGRGAEISLDVRKLIIKLYCQNKSYRKIGEFVDRSFSSVRNVIKHYISTRKIEPETRVGRPKKFDARQERIIVSTVNGNPMGSAVKLCQELQQSFKKKICPQTVRNVLNKAGYNGRVPRRKPFISKVNKAKRLIFAKKIR